MAVSSEEPTRESLADQHPLLLERCDGLMTQELIIDVERGSEVSSSGSSDFEVSHAVSPNHDGRATNTSQVRFSGSSSSSPTRINSSYSSFLWRNEGVDHHNWSLFNSGFWLSIELLFTLSQIIASIIVLCLSRHEHPQAPLFAWIVGYTAGCFASLPLLYWRFVRRNRAAEQGVAQASQVFPRADSMSGQGSYVTISLSQPSEQGDRRSVSGATIEGQAMEILNTRFDMVMDHFKMALDCFFAVWFVVGNVWIFGGHASAADAPNLYRLCIVYLTLSCIGYAMPFILCAMICCCLPCLISFLGIRENLSQVQGASEESINSLPTYKFKVKKDGGNTRERNPDELVGIVAAGTAKERMISGEDAVCCICLMGYMDDDELRELPCLHFFHAVCVDRWLKINAACPLCKNEICEREASPSQTNSSQDT